MKKLFYDVTLTPKDEPLKCLSFSGLSRSEVLDLFKSGFGFYPDTWIVEIRRCEGEYNV